ncbi:MAG: prephenate dehydrogenase [Puniceicoccales bacterium]|nr:prephenate dehydrogenase [Puniceicoccales bacterium]
MFQKIAILGPGLLGASLMQAVRERGLARHLAAWSRSEGTRAACVGRAWCDSVHESPAECVRGAELVVVCVPVDRIVEVLAAAASGMGGGAIVSDVGSVKAGICRAAGTVVPAGAFFIGSHPMAGTEKSGLEHASAGLFEGRSCFVTPPSGAVGDGEEWGGGVVKAVGVLERFWRALGMRTFVVSPQEHDEIVAGVSHLPHFAAVALAGVLMRRPSQWREFGGPGLRDTTRVAGGDPGIWCAIASENRAQILDALDNYRAELDSLRAVFRDGDDKALYAMLSRAKEWRDLLPLLPGS